MSAGYYEGRAAVEFYKGEWILRASIPEDRPIVESELAANAMNDWKRRNRLKYESLKDG